MDNFNIKKEEYAEFLNYKREKILKQAENEAQRISEQIALLNKGTGNGVLTPPPVSQKRPHRKSKKASVSVGGKKGDVGWRDILRGILSATGRPMTYSEIVEAAMKLPGMGKHSKTTIQRSVSSNLITYSKNGHERYVQTEKEGRKLYTLNKG